MSPEKRQELLGQLKVLQTKLAEVQGERPLILPSVDNQAIASVVADWTGIPVGRMVKNEIDAVLKLADTLEQRVIGQRHALETLAKRIQTSRAGMDNPSRPIGVFLLVGPSGVGKTETALTLAETLYGGEQNLITINMSEFQEAPHGFHAQGRPAGIRRLMARAACSPKRCAGGPTASCCWMRWRRPTRTYTRSSSRFSTRAGWRMARGERSTSRNTVIILTSNVGTDLIMNMCKDPDLMPGPDGIAKALREPLLKTFPAALAGPSCRLFPTTRLATRSSRASSAFQLGRIEKRLAANHKIPFTYDPEVVKLISGRCTEVESGARAVDAILTHTLLPAISRTLPDTPGRRRGGQASPRRRGRWRLLVRI